jgi:DNA (cytosine-5)-methyltransferase 1
MENVRGLLSAALRHRPIKERPEYGGLPLAENEEPGSVVRQFAADLAVIDTPYRMDCFEVNAVNYGAPQLRERALFLGNRFNAVADFPNPTHGSVNDEQEPPGLFSQAPAKLTPWTTLRDAIGRIHETEPAVMDFSPRKKKYLAMIPPGSNWRSLPPDIQRESMGDIVDGKGGKSGWWRRLTFDLPCPTLVTMPNHASTSLCHPSELRALSISEYKAIQEFPDEWCLCGKLAQQYAQVGNAVPVRLGEVAGEVVAQALDALAARDWIPTASKTERYRIVYVQSHVRTRQWYRNGESVVWQDGQSNNDASYSKPKTKRTTKSLL